MNDLHQQVIWDIMEDTTSKERFTDIEICCEDDNETANDIVYDVVGGWSDQDCIDFLEARKDFNCSICMYGWCNDATGEYFPKSSAGYSVDIENSTSIKASYKDGRDIKDKYMLDLVDAIENAGDCEEFITLPEEPYNSDEIFFELIHSLEQLSESDFTQLLEDYGITGDSDYIKSSYSIPASNECVPYWQFDKANIVGSFRELVNKIKDNLSKLGFVSKVGTSGFETVGADTIGVDVDIEIDKNADELSANEIQEIEDCGAELGGKNFEI